MLQCGLVGVWSSSCVEKLTSQLFHLFACKVMTVREFLRPLAKVAATRVWGVQTWMRPRESVPR